LVDERVNYRRSLKVVFLIRSLTIGGAERQLTLMARGLVDRGHAVSVVVFYRYGALESELAGTSVDILSPRKVGRWDLLGFIVRLIRLLREQRPDVIYSMLPTSNVLAFFCRFFCGKVPLIWGIRATQMEPASYDWLGRMMQFVQSCLIGRVDAAVANSRAGMRVMQLAKVPATRVRLIRNGIDSTHFLRRSEARAGIRKGLGVESSAFLIGFVGRLDPMKGHPVFFQAASILLCRFPHVRLVVVGSGADAVEMQLKQMAVQLGIADAVVWRSSMPDMPGFYSAIDLLCSASVYGEGFSNVLAEAMACGCRCVATNVGDSSDIISIWGALVPPSDPIALARAIESVVIGPEEIDRDAMRNHVLDLCSEQKVVMQTEALILELSRERI